MNIPPRGFVNIIVLIIVVLTLGGVVGYVALQNKSYFDTDGCPPTSHDCPGFHPPQDLSGAPHFVLSPAYNIHPQKSDWLIIESDKSVDLSSYSIRSQESRKSFAIGTIKINGVEQHVVIGADTAAFIHTVGDPSKDYRAENEYHLYFGQSQVAWGKDHDSIELVNPKGEVLEVYAYGYPDAEQSASNSSVPGMSKYTDAEAGIAFEYPIGWRITGIQPEQSGQPAYQTLARVLNPSRPGKADSDAPIELFLVQRFDSPCKWGTEITFASKKAFDTGWQNNSMAGVPTRMVCIETDNGWPILIQSSAFDESSKSIMDQIFSSFTFTK